MSYQDFVSQLKQLKYDVTEMGGNKVSFPYEIPAGKFRGKQVYLGFDVPSDFPNTPPGGPHIKPRILPLNTNAKTHPEKVLESQKFGPDWEYWSRPILGWAESDHTVRFYMKHIRTLFVTL